MRGNHRRDDGCRAQPPGGPACGVRLRYLAGLWNGILVAILKIQPFVATLILMVAGRGVAQLITSGQIVTFNSPDLSWFGSGSLLLFPTPVIIALLTLVAFGC